MNAGLQQCLVQGKSIYQIYKLGFPTFNFLFCQPIIRINISNVGFCKALMKLKLYIHQSKFSIRCCDNTVLIVWLLLGRKTPLDRLQKRSHFGVCHHKHCWKRSQRLREKVSSGFTSEDVENGIQNSRLWLGSHLTKLLDLMSKWRDVRSRKCWHGTNDTYRLEHIAVCGKCKMPTFYWRLGYVLHENNLKLIMLRAWHQTPVLFWLIKQEI